MKAKKVLATVLAAAMTFSLAACGSSETATETTTDAAPAAESTEAEAPAEIQQVSLRVWGAEEDQALLATLIEGFKETYKDYAEFDIEIGTESESTAKDTILTDIEAAADVYAFANDQLTDLVNAGALLELDTVDEALVAYTGNSLADILAANGEGSVLASQKDGKTYAFPMGGGNNYFLYYDSTVVTDPSNWDAILADCAAANKKAGMTFASGWYNASFFQGAGFTTGMNADGTTTIDWNGTSPSGITGVQVAQAMLNLSSNAAFLPIADGDISNQIASGDLAAVVSGTWDAQAAQDAFGDGYAAAKLPTYTCADKQVQMGCYSGFKLIGVNAYSKQAGWAALLGEYLTNMDSQVARFQARQLAPTNTVASADPAVMQNIAIAASAEQDAFGQVQYVGGKFWDPTATFGEMMAQGSVKADDEAGIQAALDTLVEGVTAPVE